MTPGKGKYVMLSYNHKSKEIVSQVKEQLENNGIPVWFDERDMEDNMFESMPKAVGDALAVCCFMTEGYENSRNCKLELEHAQRRGKRIIPCMTNSRKIWKPSQDGWLEFITGSLIAIDLSDISEENISIKFKKLIDRINEKSSDSSPSLAPDPSDFFKPIKHEYLRNSRIQRMMNEENSFPIEQGYINLAIVETVEQREKEEKLHEIKHHEGIISTFEEIYGSKTMIDVEDIFEKCKDETKKVLVLGRAGIGKSTFCRYISYRWAKGEILTRYKLVILIPLRLLTNSRYPPGHKYSPVDFVEKEYFPCDTISEQDRQHFKQLCDKGEVLWLLDGYDEFLQNTPEQLKDVFNHIHRKQHHILTSRPYSISLSYDIRMEITGFTNDNIVEYVNLFFEQIKDQIKDALSEGEKLLNFLKSNPSIWGVAHIPVNIELICNLWNDINRSTIRIQTMTGLYDSMIEWLCRRYLIKQKNLSTTDIEAMFKRDVYKYCKKELIFLENLAFNAMISNTLILQPTSYEKALKDANATIQDTQHILNIGILKSFTANLIGNQGQIKGDYYFVHLSFQEHLAARHLVNALGGSLRKEAIEFIKGNKYNQRFALVFTFASGLLNVNESAESHNIFWNTLSDEPLDLLSFRHIRLKISCIEETHDKSEIHRRAEIIDSLRKWIKYVVPTRHSTLYDQLVTSLQRSPSLVREQIIIDQVTELLNNSNPKIKSNTCYFISAISIYYLHPMLLSLFAFAFKDDDNHVRRNACDALGELGEQGATNEVISKLVSALTDDDWHVRSSACKALGKIGEKVATNKVISNLVSALVDAHWDVRNNACLALGRMGEKAATNEVMSYLVNALADDNWTVTISAYTVLGKMVEKAATIEVISKLVLALEHKSRDVRKSACFVFGEMGEKAATNKVISKLVNVLADTDLNVRISACSALRKIVEKSTTSEVMSNLLNALANVNKDVRQSACSVLAHIDEKAATNEVISKLLNVLADDEPDVRGSACFALGEIGDKVARSEVISNLANVFADANEGVRQSACRALCRMGKKEAKNEVISKLLSVLADTNKDVRESTCFTLGEIGEKAVTSEVISKLVCALADDEPGVRAKACEALGKMGEKAATNEVISNLLSVLVDNNKDVRGNACSALGKLGEKAATSDVISNLVNKLADTSYDVKRSAYYALCRMSEKQATSEIISKLVSALAHDDEYVRGKACSILGEMGEKAATNEVISKLGSTLVDSDKDVMQNACVALGRMGEKAATNEVISNLASALTDSNYEVKRSACEVLGKMGEKAATNEVINKLVSVLGDEDLGVRCSAYFALGEMGEEAVTSEVISKLLSAFTDDERVVRGRRMEREIGKRKACEVLGKMGEKAATSEVINKLVSALADDDMYVVKSACEALVKMGEKIRTNDVTQKLLKLFENWHTRDLACEVLKPNFGSFAIMTQLDSDTVEMLLRCLERQLLEDLSGFASDILIKVFLHTKNSAWLPIITFVTLQQGNALTAVENTIIVHGNKESVKVENCDKKLLDLLVNAFVEQAVRLDLPDMRSPKAQLSIDLRQKSSPSAHSLQKADVIREQDSSVCNVL